MSNTELRTVELFTPLVLGAGDTKTEIKTLSFRVPVAGDLRGIGLQKVAVEMEFEAVAKLAARVCTVPIKAGELFLLSLPDVVKVTAEIAGFFNPPGGETLTAD